MNVACPSCNALFDVDDALLVGPGLPLCDKCSRQGEAPPPPPAPPMRRRRPKVPEIFFKSRSVGDGDVVPDRVPSAKPILPQAPRPMEPEPVSFEDLALELDGGLAQPAPVSLPEFAGAVDPVSLEDLGQVLAPGSAPPASLRDLLPGRAQVAAPLDARADGARPMELTEADLVPASAPARSRRRVHTAAEPHVAVAKPPVEVPGVPSDVSDGARNTNPGRGTAASAAARRSGVASRAVATATAAVIAAVAATFYVGSTVKPAAEGAPAANPVTIVVAAPATATSPPSVIAPAVAPSASVQVPVSAPSSAARARPLQARELPVPSVSVTAAASPAVESAIVIVPPAAGPVEFDESAAKAALSGAAAVAAGCKKPDDPAGSARVSVTFAPSGQVASSVVMGPPFEGTATGRCVAQAFRQARVKPFSGKPVTILRDVGFW